MFEAGGFAGNVVVKREKIVMNYTKEQFSFLRRYRTLPRYLLTIRYNARFGTNKTIIGIISVCKRKGWPTGRDGRFEKGSLPWNTGTKGVCKRNSGCFRKGDRPKNWKPVGSERINTGDGCILIKVAEPNKWRYKHVVVWEAIHGKAMKGQVVRFKDSDPLNCDPDNLEAVSRQVHLYLNRNDYTGTPERYKPTMLVIAKIEVKIFDIVGAEDFQPLRKVGKVGVRTGHAHACCK